MKKTLFLCIFISFGVFIGLIVFVIHSSNIDNKSTDDIKLSDSNRLQDNDKVELDEDVKWKEYKYDFKNGEIPFSIDYPSNYTIVENSGTGAWDLSLSKNGKNIYIDASGVSTTEIDKAINLWLNAFDEAPIDTVKTTIEQGFIMDNKLQADEESSDLINRYIIFEVEFKGEKWTYTIVDVGSFNSENSRTYLTVKTNENNTETVKKIMESIEFSE